MVIQYDRYQELLNGNSFYDVMAYFLKAESVCLSLAYLNPLDQRIIVKSNCRSTDDNDEIENVENNIQNIADLIHECVSDRAQKNDLNERKEDFFDLIVKQKLQEKCSGWRSGRLDEEYAQNKQSMSIDKFARSESTIKVIKNIFLTDGNGQNQQTFSIYQLLTDCIQSMWELFVMFIKEFKNRFGNEAIPIYLGTEINYKLIHSELLVADVVIEERKNVRENFQNARQTYYIGSNLKNCPCCRYYLEIINEEFGNDINIETCGYHSKFYSTWPFPSLLQNPRRKESITSVKVEDSIEDLNIREENFIFPEKNDDESEEIESNWQESEKASGQSQFDSGQSESGSDQGESGSDLDQNNTEEEKKILERLDNFYSRVTGNTLKAVSVEEKQKVIEDLIEEKAKKDKKGNLESSIDWQTIFTR